MTEAVPTPHSALGARRPGGCARLWVLVVAIAATGAVLYFAWVRNLTALDAPMRIPWWVLAASFGLAEILVVHLEFREDAHTFSISEIATVLALFFCSPSDLVLGQVVGVAVALTVHRRQRPEKLVFNLAQFGLQACLASTVFHAISRVGDPLGPLGWVAALAATLACLLVSDALINLAIRLSGGGLGVTSWFELTALGVAGTVTSTTLGLLAATLLWTDPVAAWLLAVPTIVAVLGYGSYMSTKERRSRLDSLYESARVLHEAMRSESALIALLSQSREMFKAEVVEMTVFVAEDEHVARRTTVGPGDKVEIAQIVVHEPTEPAAARVQGKGGVADRPWRRTSIRDRGRDVIVAPLLGESGSVGTLLVGNRLGDVGAFDAEDLRMLHTLGNHIGNSIENVRLLGLREAVTELTEANRLKDDFLGMVSHELRTPITVIRGAARTLLDPDHGLTEGDRRSLLESIDRSGDRLGRLVEDLLAQARIESRRESIDLAEVEVSGAIARVLEEFSNSNRRHELEVKVPADLPPIMSDVNILHHILRNLVENAFKYAPEGTTITIAGTLEDGRAVISVEDEGPGIPGPLQQKIFERYFQVDGSNRRRSGGVGLGLYISRQMADLVGGRLWLQRSDEHGSVFCLSAPVAREGPSPGSEGRVRLHAANA